MADIAVPTIPVVLATAAVDSINPCAIGVLVLLISTLLNLADDRKKMLKVGLIYISAVFTSYLAAGYGLLYFIQILDISETLTWIVGILVIILGIIEIKDFWWYGKGVSLRIPKKQAKKIHEYVEKVTVPGAVFLGFFVAAVELPCTGGPYLAITTLLARQGFTLEVFWLLMLYNFIFVLPLIIILIIVYFGMQTEKVKQWKEEEKKWMRLWIGIVMILLGVALLLWSYGVIGFTIG